MSFAGFRMNAMSCERRRNPGQRLTKAPPKPRLHRGQELLERSALMPRTEILGAATYSELPHHSGVRKPGRKRAWGRYSVYGFQVVEILAPSPCAGLDHREDPSPDCFGRLSKRGATNSMRTSQRPSGMQEDRKHNDRFFQTETRRRGRAEQLQL